MLGVSHCRHLDAFTKELQHRCKIDCLIYFCSISVRNYYKVTQIKGMVISHKITDFQNKKNHRSGLFCQKVHAQHLGGHMGAFNIPRPIHLIRYTQQKDRSGGREKLRVIVSLNY